MKHVQQAFKVLEDGESIPVGSQWIPYHMVFNVKVDFTRKAQQSSARHCMVSSPVVWHGWHILQPHYMTYNTIQALQIQMYG